MVAALIPTRTIPQLPAYGVSLQGSEQLEIWSVNLSLRITTRDFVLPTDPLVTAVPFSSTLPFSRSLTAGFGIFITDTGPGGQLIIDTVGSGTTGPEAILVLAAGDNNDVDIGAGRRLLLDTAAGPAVITGIAGGADGERVLITNTGPNDATVTNENLNSLDINRQYGLGNTILPPRASMWLSYSGTLLRWVMT